MAQDIYDGKGVLFWIMQISTFAILILAANTAYADFPRLSSIIARDGFLPRQFANRGDRLVFSNGVIFLAVMASLLIVVFDGDISKLIPLYALGVFTGFTLSQTGMVRHHLRLREPRWKISMVINAVGAVATFLIATVVVVSKFTEGAWIPAALIPIMVFGFWSVGKHYHRVREAVQIPDDYRAKRPTHYVVVLVGSVNRGTLEAIAYARSLSPERIIALSVVQDADEERTPARAVGHPPRAASSCTPSPRRTASSPARCSTTSTRSTPSNPTTSSPSSSPSSSPRCPASGCTTSRRWRSRLACCTGRTPSW